MRTALEAGIDAGGATIDDFRHADGVRGSFQDQFLVHRRRGEPCPACGDEVVKFVAAGRGTYARASAASPGRLGRGLGQLAQAARAIGLDELHEPADDLVPDDDLREAHQPGELDEPRATLGVLREVHLGYSSPRCSSRPLAREQNEQGSVV